MEVVLFFRFFWNDPSCVSEQEPQIYDHLYLSVTYGSILFTIDSLVCLGLKLFNTEIKPEILAILMFK